MTFAQPHLLWLLAIPAALLLTTAFARARVSANPHPKIPRARIRSGQWSAVIGRWSASPRPLAACLALACLILALARPQGAAISTPTFVQARDVLVAVDVSRSMLADDVPPTRLARARLLVRDLADALRGERLGLLPFAGTAFLQSPLSADYEIFRTFVDELGPDMIPVGGSDFAGLLRVAADAFGPAPGAGDGAPAPDRYLIILSDGEAENDAWRPLAQRLAERGVRVIALGLGTSAGAMVPDKDGGLAKDARGAAVLSRLNPATLQELARATDGAYRDASTWVDLPALLKETVARGHAARANIEQTSLRRELFPWFLAPALILLACSLVREFPPVPHTSRPIPRPAPTAVARLILLALGLHCITGLSPSLLAADSEPAPAPAPDPLFSLVEKLSASAKLSAPDLARLATLSAERGEQARAQPKSAGQFPGGALRDALAAVAAGQTADPRAADWPALRKRLEALLAPPPEQQQQQQQNQQQTPKQQDQSQKSPDHQPQSSDPSASPTPPEKSQPDQSQSKSQSNESKSDSESGGDSSSNSPDKSSSQNASAGSPPKPAGDKPLGDLASAPKPEPKTDSPDKAPAPTPASASDPADEPAQQAGGVSASGRPADPDSAADTAAIDPALVVPQQRLERVRDADSPARLFQLLQDSETPPEERERRAAGSKQTW